MAKGETSNQGIGLKLQKRLAVFLSMKKSLKQVFWVFVLWLVTQTDTYYKVDGNKITSGNHPGPLWSAHWSLVTLFSSQPLHDFQKTKKESDLSWWNWNCTLCIDCFSSYSCFFFRALPRFRLPQVRTELPFLTKSDLRSSDSIGM